MYQVLRIPNSDEEVRVKDPDVKQALLQAFKEVNSPEFDHALPVAGKKVHLPYFKRVASTFYEYRHLLLLDLLIDVVSFILVIIPASLIQEWDMHGALILQERVFRGFLLVVPLKNLLFNLCVLLNQIPSDCALFGLVIILFLVQLGGIFIVAFMWVIRGVVLPFVLGINTISNIIVAYFTAEQSWLDGIRKFLNLKS